MHLFNNWQLFSYYCEIKVLQWLLEIVCQNWWPLWQPHLPIFFFSLAMAIQTVTDWSPALKGLMGWWLAYNHVLDSRLRSLYSRFGSMVLLHWVFHNAMHDVFFTFRMDRCAEYLSHFIQTNWICHQGTLMCKCWSWYKMYLCVI